MFPQIAEGRNKKKQNVRGDHTVGSGGQHQSEYPAKAENQVESRPHYGHSPKCRQRQGEAHHLWTQVSVEAVDAVVAVVAAVEDVDTLRG